MLASNIYMIGTRLVRFLLAAAALVLAPLVTAIDLLLDAGSYADPVRALEASTGLRGLWPILVCYYAIAYCVILFATVPTRNERRAKRRMMIAAGAWSAAATVGTAAAFSAYTRILDVSLMPANEFTAAFCLHFGPTFFCLLGAATSRPVALQAPPSTTGADNAP
jgi:hypothetical protein